MYKKYIKCCAFVASNCTCLGDFSAYYLKAIIPRFVYSITIIIITQSKDNVYLSDITS